MSGQEMATGLLEAASTLERDMGATWKEDAEQCKASKPLWRCQQSYALDNRYVYWSWSNECLLRGRPHGDARYYDRQRVEGSVPLRSVTSCAIYTIKHSDKLSSLSLHNLIALYDTQRRQYSKSSSNW